MFVFNFKSKSADTNRSSTYDRRMRKLPWMVLLNCIFLCACSSTSKKQNLGPFPAPPANLPLPSSTSGENPSAIDHELEKLLRDNHSEAARYLVRYQQAKLWTLTDAARACAMWTEISTDTRFPLSPVARIRAVQTCPLKSAEINNYALALSNPQPLWLKEDAIRAALAYAIRASDEPAEMQSSFDLAPLTKLQSDQITLLNRTLFLAKRIGNQRFAELTQQTLEKIAPRLITAPKPEQFALVAADFRRVREFEKSRENYKKEFARSDNTDFEKLRALDGIRMTFKLQGQREKFIEATRAYSDFAQASFAKKPSPFMSKYVDTRLTLARAIWTDNNAAEARVILDHLEKELKGRHPLDESLFLRARIEDEAGNLQKTTQILSKIDENRISDRTQRSKVLWYRAWTFRKVGKLQEASTLFEQLAKEETASPVLARDRFWLARTLKEKGDKQRAETEFKALIETDPLGYYGLLAYRELGLQLPPLISVPNPRQPSSDAETKATPAQTLAATSVSTALLALHPDERFTFDWLIATDELELARRFLDQFGSARRASFSEPQMLDFLQLYARAGAYQSLFARLAELSPETRTQILKDKPELIFPRPWMVQIDNAAAKHGLQSELIYSIMRQESSFNPLARSGADAFGLMQLIPEVATRASETAGLHFKAHEDLYQPDLNIALGATVLRTLLNRWDNHFIPAVASYNASEKALLGWFKTRDRKDPLQFIEDVPFEETKGYIKLVMRNYIFYSRLSAPTQPLTFPEWCLSGIQDIKL